MDNFQQKTAAIFTRRALENAFDRADENEMEEMSRLLDVLTLLRLREDQGDGEALA